MQEASSKPIMDVHWLNKNATWHRSKRHYTVSIFDFPADLLELSTEDKVEQAATDVVLRPEELEIRNAYRCRVCAESFEDITTMRSHFKSDAHAAKIRKETASEISSARVTDGHDRSDSDGGDSASSDDDCDATTRPEVKLPDLPNGDYVVFDQGAVKKSYSSSEGARTIYRRTIWEPFEFSVSNAVLESQSQGDADGDTPDINPWRTVHRTLQAYSVNPMWFVVSLRSGRFAGAIFDGNKEVCHKTFRRYTIRAKAGGAQSSNDNTGKRVQSIGSSLRRHGEQMLKEDIRALLKSWATLISNSSIILLSVPKTMRPTLFEEENSTVLDKKDSRIRYVPFMTDKPSFETIKEIHTICSSVYFRDATIAPVEEQHETKKEPSATTPKTDMKLGPIKEATEDDRSVEQPALISCPESDRLFDLLRRVADNIGERKEEHLPELEKCLFDIRSKYMAGPTDEEEHDATAIGSSLLSSPVAFPPMSREISLNLTAEEIIRLPGSLDNLWAPLHWAAEIGNSDYITRILSFGADPTARDIRGRTPYFICKTKDARDAFRRYRATAESQWNWTDAGVPEGLTAEMERMQKEKEKEKKKRAKQKKLEQKEKEKTEAVRSAEKCDDQVPIPPGELKTRVASAGVCAKCNISLFRKTTTSISGFECCSADCAAKLKRKLAADAAIARFKSR